MVLLGHGKDPRGRTDAYPIVQEYFERKALSEIGFTSDLGSLPAWKAKSFQAIASEIAAHREREFEKSRKKKG